MMSDADINAILDQAVRDVSTRFRWPFLATTDTIALVASTQAYNLPADLDRIEAITLDGTNHRLQEVSPTKYWSAYGDTPEDGEPRFFFLWSNQIWVTPVPTAAGTLNLFYYRMPTLMGDDGDSPEWASQFHMIVADYACQHLFHREEDFSKAKLYGEAYLDGIERMARYYLGRAIDSPFIIGDRSGVKSHPHDGWRFGPLFP